MKWFVLKNEFYCMIFKSCFSLSSFVSLTGCRLLFLCPSFYHFWIYKIDCDYSYALFIRHWDNRMHAKAKAIHLSCVLLIQYIHRDKEKINIIQMTNDPRHTWIIKFVFCNKALFFFHISISNKNDTFFQLHKLRWRLFLSESRRLCFARYYV